MVKPTEKLLKQQMRNYYAKKLTEEQKRSAALLKMIEIAENPQLSPGVYAATITDGKNKKNLRLIKTK